MASHDQQWYMDTRATSHISYHIGNLQTSSLNRNFYSAIVENGSSKSVTHSGHVQIPNPYRPLHLRNVLVTPNIIKNLVSVRKFTIDNKCSIDFDPYGFTVRDYHTRQTLLRCDSTSDLYPLHVAASAFAILTNKHSASTSWSPWTLVDTEKKFGPEGPPITDPTLYRSLAGAFRTTNLGLQLFRSTTSHLIAYSDADWACCPATCRSTSEYCVFLGDNLLTWSSKRQDTLSRSSAEAEYRVVANVVAETSWIRNLLRELHTALFTTTLVYYDNVSAVYMSANPVQHQRTKHIEIDTHFVRDKVAAGHVRVLHVPSQFLLELSIFRVTVRLHPKETSKGSGFNIRYWKSWLEAGSLGFPARASVFGAVNVPKLNLQKQTPKWNNELFQANDTLVCNDYGIVVDVFIPNKKSKAGKHFAFVRFIKIINLDRLIENLNTIWIGRFHLFTNRVRFERPKKLVFPTYKDMPATPSNSTGFRKPKAQDHAGSYVNVVNGSSTAAVHGPYISSASTLVLDDLCVVERDLSKYAMGKVKDVNSIPNIRTLLMDEGFFDVKLKYLGGVKSWFHVIQDAVHDFVSDERIVWVDIEGIPLNVWSRETFMRIGKKWGDTLDIENNVDTKQPLSILESFKIIFKGKVLLVRAKELFTWNPTFLAHKEMVYASEDELVHSPKKIPAHSPFSEEVSGDDSESDVEEVSDTIFGDNSSSPNSNIDEMGKQHSEDPFKIYDILKKQRGGETREVSSSLSHPPGFTPEVSEIRKENDQGAEEFLSLVNAKVMNNSQEVYQEINRESVDPNVVKEGGFILRVLEDMIRVGQAMGDAVGNSGGILYVWEANVFKKYYATISDNFVAIYGTWLPSNSKIPFVAIYAPQQASCKRVLWEYVSNLIGRWNGETIILGDFNECLQNEHYALWEVIEFGDSYKAPLEETSKGLASESSARKKGRTVAITTKDMQKRRNDVKARTTLLLALPDEHQLRFSKIETTDQETKIIATVDGKPQTISGSSLRRHLKLNDEEWNSSLPDAELFENLSLMRYNILPSQRTVPLFASMIVTQGEGLANPTKAHHTPSPQEHQSPQSNYSTQHASPPLSHQTIISEPIPYDLQVPTKTLTLRRLTKRAIRIAQSKALSPAADEPASLSRDDRHGEAFPTVSSLDTGQDRENIAKTSTMSHESSPRVPSLDVDEGREELGADKSTEKGSNDTEKMVNMLSSMEAANILSSEGTSLSTVSVFPGDVFSIAGVPTVSGSFPSVSAIFTTASVATPYTRMLKEQTIIKEGAREGVSEEELKGMMQLVPLEEVYIEALQEIHTEGKREYWKIIRLGGHTGAYQFFVDMLKQIDREDLHQLWILVKETFSIKQCTRDKEKELWVELKRLFEPDSKD
uniref:RNA-directed DNA polymerase, eukaryota n=1 Tax=Tanacetum cinerariifolium TaxID=118510 RepID=A0A6L2KPG2_TANCI|nr:hypothetical protein [Tanacetum cinerariifolium]